jgi:RluA family pseudouridine synthase
MRLHWNLSALAVALTASTTVVTAFAPSPDAAIAHRASSALRQVVAAAGPDVKARQDITLEKLKAKDAASHAIAKDDLDVVFEDAHIVVVSKPSGVLTVPGKDESNPSLNRAVFERFGSESGRMDKMVVHRLGMDTSGLVVFARTDAALRGMNALFRARKVTRVYEAMVCGHVSADVGSIDFPLMRDYECPPFMRVSTDDHQRALAGLDAGEVGKKLLEGPKDSLTKYEVVSRESLDGNDVTRLALTSVSGRTHQLNVHCAAIGHPIVGDAVYGYDGEAASNGGLDEIDLPEDRADVELQRSIATARQGMPMCVHAKTISFRHPVTKEQLSFESKSSF